MEPVLFPESRAALIGCTSRAYASTLNLHLDGASGHRCLPEIGQALGQDFSAQIEAYAVPDAGTPTNQVNGKHNDLWPFDLGKPDEARAVFDHLIGPLYEDGTDFLWLDGQNGDTPGMNNQLWPNHVFYRDLAERRPDERPLSSAAMAGWARTAIRSGSRATRSRTGARWSTRSSSRRGRATSGRSIGATTSAGTCTASRCRRPVCRWTRSCSSAGCSSGCSRLSHACTAPMATCASQGLRAVFVDAFREITHLRMSLQPYFYHLGRKPTSAAANLPPAYLHYPEDDAAYTRLDEYLAGRSLAHCAKSFEFRRAARGVSARRALWAWLQKARTQVAASRYSPEAAR